MPNPLASFSHPPPDIAADQPPLIAAPFCALPAEELVAVTGPNVS